MLLFCFVWVLSCRGLRTLLEADYHTLPWKRRSLCSRLALSPLLWYVLSWFGYNLQVINRKTWIYNQNVTENEKNLVIFLTFETLF